MTGVVLKSERELLTMREAGRVNALALSAAAAVVRPGITTSEIGVPFFKFCRKRHPSQAVEHGA